MISTWSEWKRYPRAERGENIEAPISPGIFEVRYAATGALFSFDAVENVASALSQLPVSSKSWFGVALPCCRILNIAPARLLRRPTPRPRWSA
jgi:hypothetical protein